MIKLVLKLLGSNSTLTMPTTKSMSTIPLTNSCVYVKTSTQRVKLLLTQKQDKTFYLYHNSTNEGLNTVDTDSLCIGSLRKEI